MARPSIYHQLPGAVQVLPDDLQPSPRHWNSSIIQIKKTLYLAYRHHLQTPDARCAIAICKLDPKTFQPAGKSKVLVLGGPTGAEHHEDPRFFFFKGRPYISYTEMRGYRPGIDYTCVVKYAALDLDAKGNWKVIKTYQPRYGQNNGYSKEKNWTFFEQGGKLYCFYEGSPRHVILEINEGQVVKEFITVSPVWPWGTIRGGASPILWKGQFLHIFHSSVQTEQAPHFVRYFAGAYTFEAQPPFAPIKISAKPFAAGSEVDGHQVDPRYVQGWKPFVVFPCGVIDQGDRLLVSMGVNDWQTTIAPVSEAQLQLVSADGSQLRPRFFRTANGTLPIEIIATGGEGRRQWLQWEVPTTSHMQAGAGYMKATNARVAEEIASLPNAEEIEENTYLQAIGQRPSLPVANWR